MEKPKLIEDLGFLIPINGNQKDHFGVFECPFCKTHCQARIYQIKRGHTKSCGCYQRSNVRRYMTTHGLSKTPVYHTWRCMLGRCYIKKNTKYEYYGGRGIIVCEEWRHNYMSFYNWAMSNGYEVGLTIDRKENDGNYTPDNCRFVNRFINAQNKRPRKNKSGYTGVCLIGNRYVATIVNQKKWYYLGYYNTSREAAIIRNNWITEHSTAHPLNIIANA